MKTAVSTKVVDGTTARKSVLLVKMSSLGDIVHTFPALTDATEVRPELAFCWLVEETFVDLVRGHPAVERVIPIALRRWRRTPWRCRREFSRFRRELGMAPFDLVLDAQGLIKSAVVARLAHTSIRAGYDWHSARESAAALAYNRSYSVSVGAQAIQRTRNLFAQALDYPVPAGAPRFGLPEAGRGHNNSYLLLLHGSAWDSKRWPLAYWRALAECALEAGVAVHIPFGNSMERKRAAAIAEGFSHCRVLAPMDLSDLMVEIRGAWGVVTVDSGLGHLAAACDVPVVGFYGSTDAERTGLQGEKTKNLQSSFACSPCLKRRCPLKTGMGSAFNITCDQASDTAPPCVRELKPRLVWQILRDLGGTR